MLKNVTQGMKYLDAWPLSFKVCVMITRKRSHGGPIYQGIVEYILK